MADDELSHGERRILDSLLDIRGQLNGIGNKQTEIGAKLNRLNDRVSNLEATLSKLGHEVLAKAAVPEADCLNVGREDTKKA